MHKRLTKLIISSTSLKNLAITVTIVVLFQIAFNAFLPAFVEATGGTLLDMSIGYSSDFAYERLTTFHLAADVYFKIRLIDFFFPAAYAVCLSVLSCFVYRKKYEDADNYRWILIVPFLAAVLDYVENIILVILYQSLPAQYHIVASILNIVTILKFCLVGFSVMLFITGAFSILKGGDSMLLMGNKFKGKKQNKEE